MAPTTKTDQDLFYMREALREAELAGQLGEVPIGAVIVCGGRIIARAHNEVERLQDPTAHAEVLAITAATQAMGSKFLPDCTLYVTVEPCTMCAGALYWSRVGRIVYGASEDKFGYRRYAPQLLPRRKEVLSGVLGEEAASLMQRFFKDRR